MGGAYIYRCRFVKLSTYFKGLTPGCYLKLKKSV